MIRGLFTSRVSCLMYAGVRGMAVAVEKATLSKLRKRTGISFINCKKALEQFDNDLEQAEKWLKEQAQKEGWTKATKLQGRSMSNGLIAVVANNQAVTMIEVNCETDFVSRNDKFIKLASILAQECHQVLLNNSKPTVFLDKDVGSLPASTGASLADLVALEMGNIGENMALRRAVHLKEQGSILSSYVHASGPDITTDIDCQLGKYGVVVSLNQTSQPPSSDMDELSPPNEISYLIGQHIVGMNPRQVGCYKEFSARKAEARKEDARKEDPREEEARKEDPQQDASEVMENPEKEGGDDGKVPEEKEEDRLLFQEFLLDSNTRVGDMLKKNGVVVNTFYRFACGEELPEEEKLGEVKLSQ